MHHTFTATRQLNGVLLLMLPLLVTWVRFSISVFEMAWMLARLSFLLASYIIGSFSTLFPTPKVVWFIKESSLWWK